MIGFLLGWGRSLARWELEWWVRRWERCWAWGSRVEEGTSFRNLFFLNLSCIHYILNDINTDGSPLESRPAHLTDWKLYT